MDSKSVLLIGHRGVGKTSLLRRIQCYCKEQGVGAETVDLDEYIESAENKKISKIFTEDGEKKFRKLEKKYLKEIVTSADKKTYISIGAGFMGPYPDHAEVIFIKRTTDKNGRIFLNRPRLNSSVSAFDEYKDIYLKREQHYMSHADKSLVLQEGLKENNLYEKLFFGFTKVKLGPGVYSLLPHEVESIDDYLRLGFDKVEVRTDLFDQESIIKLIKQIPEENLLLSHRGNKSKVSTKYMDWPLELGEPKQSYHIISSHNKTDHISEAILKLNKYANKCDHLKLAVEVNNLDELKIGHAWHLENPKKNCFLPMSPTGRYSWYRLIHKNKMYPNFFKTTEQGTALDQPYFYEWVNASMEKIKGFAAIIGNPVDHSWTPNEHESFFSKFDMPVVKINLSENELSNEYLNFLANLGLKAAAVTSPLKSKISHLVNGENSLPVNTLVMTKKGWLTRNTDDSGFNAFADGLQNNKNIILWGGGGVVPSIKAVLPEISSYSARTGKPRTNEPLVANSEILIWAIGRSRHKNWPDPSLRPKKIVDLNYSADSPGKEYALMVGAEYVSGELMFTEQAKEQQIFWSENL